ncbi:MAG: ribosomal-processing cysteine protease Prp [Kurthia sp.]|nr:ribosomal-processing cysteine protease Prp [Candidatus Kurthia equi]
MITVEIHSNENRESYGFEISGHAYSGEPGHDLVCAGASAIAIGSVNAIGELVKITPGIEQGQEGGFLSVVIDPNDLTPEQNVKLQLILQMMVTQFYTMVASYGDYIEIKYKMR